jgi:hypothetical protein
VLGGQETHLIILSGNYFETTTGDEKRKFSSTMVFSVQR